MRQFKEEKIGINLRTRIIKWGHYKGYKDNLSCWKQRLNIDNPSNITDRFKRQCGERKFFD